MRAGTSCICFAVVVAFATLTAFGQPPGPGGGGFGGPFGDPGGMRQSTAMLLGVPEVRAEVGVRDDQQKQVDELLNEFRDEMRTLFDFRGLFELSEDQRRQQFDASRKKTEEMTAKVEERLAKILGPPQLERLGQLRLQQEGFIAFARPDVVKELGLSDQQKEEIASLREQSLPQFGFGPPDFGKIEEQRRKALVDGLALLTDEQKTKWNAMTGKEFAFPQPQFGRGGPGFGPGGPMGAQERKLVKQFDENGDGWLNQEERQAARTSLASQPGGGRRDFGPPGRRGGRGGPPGGPFGRGNQQPAKPGPRVSPEEVVSHPDAALYEPTVLRTLFLEFENQDWETELQDFKGTDVDVPATLTVDGKKYANVGVHFRGMSSYMMVPAGYKRSLNISLDLVDEDQRLYGYKTLNLLNCSGDPSLMSTALYSHITRQHIPAPKANFVKVVINGESWGVYANVQQFDKIFLAENYESSKGTRWKVSGNPNADGGLRYLGDGLDEYKRRFEMKSNDGKKAWKALVELCRTLNETPLDQLEDTLEPILDIDGVLWFLAIDVSLINSDGYWTRASDYSLFRDAKGKFHIIPHDMNEAFHAAMTGPGGRRGPGGPGGRRGRGGFRPPGESGPRFGLGAPGGPRQTDAGGPQRPRNGLQREENRREAAGRDLEPRDRGRAEFGPGGPGMGGPGMGGPGGGGPGGGGPGGGGPGGGGLELDPLIGLDDPRMPLRSRLLAVPSLRAKYLSYVRKIAERSLDWKNLGPVVAQYRALIESEVEADTRRSESFEVFLRATSSEASRGTDRGRDVPLRAFADARRKFLLDYREPQGKDQPKAGPRPTQ